LFPGGEVASSVHSTGLSSINLVMAVG